MTSTSSLGRSKSLRIPAAGLTRPATQQPVGPSHVALFLTNVRLLNLDLRDDWPGITATTFSTKSTLENSKKRIDCVEWALYQLFALWDLQETQDVSQQSIIDTRSFTNCISEAATILSST